jgi:hypothetical protein
MASSTVPAGSVISQDPAAGSDVVVGTAVALVVSAGPASLSVGNVSVVEGNTGCSPCTPMTFTVALSAPSSQTVTVNYATIAGTATAGRDYNSTSGTLTFAPGEVSKTVVVQVIGDTSRENKETLTLRLSSPTNAVLANTDAIGTIVDDDSSIIP